MRAKDEKRERWVCEFWERGIEGREFSAAIGDGEKEEETE